MFDNDEILKCPYCEREQYGHCPDDDVISADMCLVKCEHCDKDFWYSVTVTRSYYPYKDESEGGE